MTKEQIAELERYMGRGHIMDGLCPDSVDTKSRDPECPECRLLTALPALLQAAKDAAQLRELVHPWYGDCDGLAPDGGCSECEQLAAIPPGDWFTGDGRPMSKASRVIVERMAKNAARYRKALKDIAYYGLCDERCEAKDDLGRDMGGHCGCDCRRAAKALEPEK